MPNKGYTQDDLDELYAEYAQFIIAKYKELNKHKDITHPTDQEMKEFWGIAIGNLTGGRCMATYLSGKHEGERCTAATVPGFKYCKKHKTLDAKYKQELEDLNDRISKQLQT
jgi:hypothetical protein